MSEKIRYGYYLRPSPAMCAAQVQIHQLLQRQYGLEVAGKFMPHATIKGFFKSSAPVDEIRAAAAVITEGMQSFPVWNNGILDWGPDAIVLGIMNTQAGGQNAQLENLHERALAAIMPLVDKDCNFTFGEWVRERYVAHLTLAMADIPRQFFDEILRFCQDLEPIGLEWFLAQYLHLYEFRSDDWHGQWGQSLTWRLLDSWLLE